MAQTPLLEAPSATTPTTVRYTALAWFCSLSMITYIDRVCIKQVQGPMQNDLGLSNAQFSWVFAAFSLAYALFEIPTGWLGDRYGPKRVLVRIVMCWLIFTMLTGVVVGTGLTALVMLCSIRFLFGMGEAGAYPNMARATRNWFPFSERGRAQGFVWTFGRWGGAIAPMLIVALTAPFDALELQGWRFGFVLLGLLGMIWLWGFMTWFYESPRDHPDVNQAELDWIEKGGGSNQKPAPLSWASMLASPTLWLLSIMYFCSNAGWSIFITYDTKFLQNDLRLEGWTLHFASGLPLLMGGIGCLLGGFLTDRQVRLWGRRWGRTAQGFIAYGAGMVFFLLVVYFTNWIPNPAIAFSCLCLASFVKDFGMGASWATTLDIGHRYSGTVAGFMNMIGNLGTVFAAPTASWLARSTSTDGTENWTAALYFYAANFGVACLCWLFINPTRVIVYSEEDRQRLKAEGVLE